MSDDDIPTLTRVVRRERREHATLTPALRASVIDAVSARCTDTIADLVQAVAVDIDALLTERVMAELHARLPALVEAALAECIEAQRGDGG